MSTWLEGPSHQDRSGRATCQSRSQIATPEEYWPTTLAPSWRASSAPLNLKIIVNIEAASDKESNIQLILLLAFLAIIISCGGAERD